jgi:iron-sulfur cluster protein
MISTPSDPKEYRRQLKAVLNNRFLSRTLAHFSSSYKESRAQAFQDYDFAALANAVAEDKDASLPRLMQLYDQFKARAEEKGAKVHLAATAGEANALISRIAYQAGVRRIVKSKSMTAEETHLNDHLEAADLQVVETDLGEWIVQLRRERPSHMVMPAIHLSRAQVADLFSRMSGRAMDPDDITAMVKLARGELRRAFLDAEMGISGANFAIAETGTIGLVTNEGNARLVTTLPRIHVALVGLEKLVPDLNAALDILKVLPKNATGQAISSYVTWITGANQCAAAEGGEKEMHIIFLDNGRLALARDPDFKEALRCIRCGACANLCPIYSLVGGHHYGHVYIGAIGLILTYFYHGRRNARAIVRNCLNCQACRSICPAKIDLPRLIKKVHARILDEEDARPLKNHMLAKVLPNRKLFHQIIRRAYLAQKPLAGSQPMIRHLPRFFDPAHSFRSLPVVAKKPLRDRWRGLTKARPKPSPGLKVAFFAGCLVDFVYPEQGEAALALLENRPVELAFPKEQTCCGLPASMMGEEETARIVARQNIRALDPAAFDYVLTLCASCASHIKESYPKLLAREKNWRGQAELLSAKIMDLSTFLSQVLKIKAPQIKGPKTAYHAPCHLCRGLGVHKAPRNLLQESGFDYVRLDNEEVCCGFGGSYSTEFPEVSARILDRKLDEVEKSGAELLVTDCPGCVLQLKGGLDHRGSRVKVMHMAEALACRLGKSK